MDALSTIVFHVSARDPPDAATQKAVALLKDFGHEVKVVHLKHAGSARRDLESSGLEYPIIKINGKYIVRGIHPLMRVLRAVK